MIPSMVRKGGQWRQTDAAVHADLRGNRVTTLADVDGSGAGVDELADKLRLARLTGEVERVTATSIGR